MEKRDLVSALIRAFQETFFMVGIALLAAIILGGALGLFLYMTSNTLFWNNPLGNQVVGVIINVIRSVPFLILLVVLIPLSKLVVKTSIGPKAVIIPLAIAAVAFLARLVEASLSAVDNGVVEASVASGVSKIRVIFFILLPEALPALIKNITVTAVSLIGFSAMAGTVGGGGIGDLAIRYGYQRYQTDVMVISVILLVVVVQLIQLVGDKVAQRVDHR